MNNYFAQLPDELIDYILLLCNQSCDGCGEFIRHEYVETPQHTIRKIYREYTGTMANGVPYGTGTMLRCSIYINSQPPDFGGFGATEWLYRPFLYILRNCNYNYKLRYLITCDLCGGNKCANNMTSVNEKFRCICANHK